MEDFYSLKKTLKKWETAFKETHDHKPSQEDIKQAPQRIRDAYQKYQHLKKSKATMERSHSGDQEIKLPDNETKDRTKAEDVYKKENLQTDFWGPHLNKPTMAKTSKKVEAADERSTVIGSISEKLRRNFIMSPIPAKCQGKENKKGFNVDTKANKEKKPKPLDLPYDETDRPKDESKIDDMTDLSFGTIGSQEVRVKNKRKLSVSKANGISPLIKKLSSTKMPRSLKTDWLNECKVTLVDDSMEQEPSLENRSPPFSANLDVRNKVSNRESSEADFISYLKQKKGSKGITKESESRKTESKESSIKSEIEIQTSADNTGSSKISKQEHSMPSQSQILEEKTADLIRSSTGQSSYKMEDNKHRFNTIIVEETSDASTTDATDALKGKPSENNCPEKVSKDAVKHLEEKKTVCYKVKKEAVSDIVPSKKRKEVDPETEEFLSTSSKKLRMSDDQPQNNQSHDGQRNGIDGEDVDDDVASGRKTNGIKSKPGVSSMTSSQPVKNLNQNFVRLNMKKKGYTRGGRRMKGEAYKRHMWHQRNKREGGSFHGGGGGVRSFDRSGDTCFKCGQSGHWASQCKGGKFSRKQESQTDVPPDQDQDFLEFPTLEEAAMKASGIKPQEGSECKIDVESIPPPVYDAPVAPPSMEPYFQPDPDGKSIEPPKEVFAALNKLGFESFRQGQREAVMNILSGISTLLILSTGTGKSLCYQLPAYLYSQRSSCLTLVISPLVSLMEDQMEGLPKCLNGARLHSHMTKTQKDKVISQVTDGKVNILLVSPEALVARGGGLLPSAAKMPPVAFACIDEAHCLSEWSHNFRPSYLMLCKVLREKYGVQCILGLTATATVSTAEDVMEHFEISGMAGSVVRGPSMPKNLVLCASRDIDKDKALVELLQHGKMSNLDSIIVYCIRREQTERVASLLRTCLQEVLHRSEDRTVTESEPEGETESKKKGRKGGKKKGKATTRPPANSAESYHAGMSKVDRRRVQNMFMSGNLRIVVATVAFGMGLDKQDVRGVIHYSMPRSSESYVQEVGRSGRDRKLAVCHLFLDSTGNDLGELKRHIHANSVDRFTIKKLVKKIFRPCKCHKIYSLQDGDDSDMENLGRCPGHEHALAIDSCVEDLDMKEEGIATLMCYLELHKRNWLRSLPATWATCTIHCYGGPKELKQVAHKSPVVAAAIAKQRLKGKSMDYENSISFDVVEVASSMGWNLWPAKKELKQLQWRQELGKGWVKTNIVVEFSDLAFHFISPGDLTDEELDEVVAFLADRVKSQERRELEQLRTIYNSLHSVSEKYHWDCDGTEESSSSQRLKKILRNYFETPEKKKGDMDLDVPDVCEKMKEKSKTPEDVIRGRIRNFISVNHDRNFSGRAIARILQGIASPNYPAVVWGRDRRFWRSLMDVDFNELVQYATQEVLSFR